MNNLKIIKKLYCIVLIFEVSFDKIMCSGNNDFKNYFVKRLLYLVLLKFYVMDFLNKVLILLYIFVCFFFGIIIFFCCCIVFKSIFNKEVIMGLFGVSLLMIVFF